MIRKLVISLFLLLPIISFGQNVDLLLINQEYAKAVKLIDSQLATKPTADLYFKKCIAHQKLQDYPSAISAIDQAILLDSIDVKLLSVQADLYQAVGNNAKAISSLKSALDIEPGDLSLKFDLGKGYMVSGDYTTAFNTFQEIQAVDSTNLIFNKYSSLAAFKAQQFKRAVYLYEKYIKQNPNDQAAYVNLAESYERLKKQPQCIITLFNAKRRFPDSRIINLKLANTAFENKNFGTAEKAYETFIAKFDTAYSTYLNYGICLYHNKKTEESINVLEECYKANPNDVYVNFYLGVCHKRLENYELSSKYIDFAIWMSIPDFHPEMYHHLAQVYSKMTEYEKAIECYKKAYELDNRKVDVLYELATLYEEYNFNKTMALAYYKDYLKEAGEGGDHVSYALDRVRILKEELFMDQN